jgi:membrane protein implicated in regulation of membrane protease activity
MTRRIKCQGLFWVYLVDIDLQHIILMLLSSLICIYSRRALTGRCKRQRFQREEEGDIQIVTNKVVHHVQA